MILIWQIGRKARYVAMSLIVMLGVLMLPDQARSDEKAEQAGEFIKALGAQAVSALTEPDITYEMRADRFKGLLSDHFAINTIGQWVLGRHWKKAISRLISI